MGLIQEPIIDPNAPSTSISRSCTSGHLVPPVVPTAGSLPFFILARQRQPPKDEEMDENTKLLVGLVVLSSVCQDEVVKISAKEAAH